MIDKLKIASTLVIGGVAALSVGCSGSPEGVSGEGNTLEASGTKSQTYREYLIDRNERVNKLADDVNGNPENQPIFKADPQKYAGRFGIRLTPEELVMIESTDSVPEAMSAMRCAMVAETTAFFDGNCGCGGGGTCGW